MVYCSFLAASSAALVQYNYWHIYIGSSLADNPVMAFLQPVYWSCIRQTRHVYISFCVLRRRTESVELYFIIDYKVSFYVGSSLVWPFQISLQQKEITQ